MRAEITRSMRTRHSLPESAVRAITGDAVIGAILYPEQPGTGGQTAVSLVCSRVWYSLPYRGGHPNGTKKGERLSPGVSESVRPLCSRRDRPPQFPGGREEVRGGRRDRHGHLGEPAAELRVGATSTQGR